MTQRLTAIVLILALSGCSLFMRGVEKDHKPPAPTDCQDFLVIPIVDGVVGASGLAVTLGGPCFGSLGSCALGLTASLGFMAAAALGYIKVKKCEKAKAQAEGGFESGSADF